MARAGLLLLSLTAAALHSQVVVSERRLGAAKAAFDDASPSKTFRCSISPVPPRLNYGFRFQAGYVVTVPMNQFEGAGHRWRILTRVTPQGGGAPVYLVSNLGLPVVPPTKVEVQIGGGFLLGEGDYLVRQVMQDEIGRTCRRDWHVDAHLSRGESKVRMAMPPGTVLDVSLRGARSPVTPDDARPMRLTILVHAAPLFIRSTRLRQNDIFTILASVSALLEHVPTTHVRLAAFNLDEQKELFRKDGFALADLPALASSMYNTELGLVDVKVLQNRRGHLETIAGLINTELTEANPSDAVVVVGPMSRYGEKLPADALEASHAHPQFLFFELAPMFRGGRGGRGPIAPPDSAVPDSLRHAVGRVGGKTLTIRSPGDLAKAISRLEQIASARTPSP